MKDLPKAYEPKLYEDDIYKQWEESGLFNPDVCVEKGVTKQDAKAFSIVLPPPNVTGTLHMGHAAMLAIEDVMIRYHRMKGDKTLWLPGTDHAAIATESKVEKLLIDAGTEKPKEILGRVEFLKKVDVFAQESHDTIVGQAKKMGASLDWTREAFTLDEVRNKAVRSVFKKMYDDGLIYRGDRIVNWDPKMQSNVADDEIEYKEEQSEFYYFQYGPFVIGTARPETKFGDKYVIMHPSDERYAKYNHGDIFTCEWINGPITATIIKDEAVDPTFGTGVMTITPWHSVVDFELAEKYKLDKEQIIDMDGRLLPIAGAFAGIPIAEARKKIVEHLDKKGLVVNIEKNYVHNVAVNYRGGGVVEPQVRKQWFIDVNKKFVLPHSQITGIHHGQEVTLKELMQTVVHNKQVSILPERFEKTYFHWIDNLRDWCISRQIWYGHQIPVWYKGEEIFVGDAAPEGDGWTQDPDTLDTWFSAGLWSFSTLLDKDMKEGETFEEWVARSTDLKDFHPTSVLETGYDILFFWVARMILMTTYTLGQIPFETVYLHGLVRDDQGRKMSKTLGNIINPLDMIEKYGTDATRLSLLIGSTPGNDVKLSEEKIAGFRNFTNKLWNISRFILLNIDQPKKDVELPEIKTLADAAILSNLGNLLLSSLIETHRYSAAGEELRDFTWNELADKYLEIAKFEENKSEVLNYVLNTILKLWHPFMPFVTEAIWKEIYGEDEMLMVEQWPVINIPHSPSILDAYNEYIRLDYYPQDVQNLWQNLWDVITSIRSLRSEKGIAPSVKLSVYIITKEYQTLFEKNKSVIEKLARLESLSVVSELEKTTSIASVVVGASEVCIDFKGAIDLSAEKIRIQKEIDHVAPYVTAQEKKLAGDFAKNAPEAIVEKERQKLQEAQEKLQLLQTQLDQLK